jgi:hypothetical protein
MIYLILVAVVIGAPVFLYAGLTGLGKRKRQRERFAVQDEEARSNTANAPNFGGRLDR